MNNKIIKYGLIILGVLVAIEILILITGIDPLAKFNNLTGQKMTNGSNSSPSDEVDTIQQANINNKAALAEFLKNQKEKNAMISSLLVQKYQGTIIEIKLEDGMSPINNFKYSLLIKIQDQENNTKSFAYNKTDLSKMEIYQMQGDTKEKITINDLGAGDEVTIEETQDITIQVCSQDECFQKFEIIKLK